MLKTRTEVLTEQQALAVGLLHRWNAREVVRESRMAAVRRLGALGAAPPLEAMDRIAHASQVEGKTLEAIQGQYDIEPVNFLPRGIRASRAVCRLADRGAALGTGFLIAPGVIITNKHVLGDLDDATGCVAEFNYEYDVDDRATQVISVPLAPDRLFLSTVDLVLDFTIIALDPAAYARVEGQLAWLPLDKRRNKIVEGEPAIVVQHPQGEDKKLCVFDSGLVDRMTGEDSPYVHYTTDTDRGASGAPVFNRHWQLIALHHASTTLQDDNGKPMGVNEGVRVSSIIGALEGDNPHVLGSSAMRKDLLAILTAPSTAGNGRPQSVVVDPVAVPVVQGPTLGRLLEGGGRTKVVTLKRGHYTGRRGFNVKFLGSGAHLAVPLPRLTAAMKSDTARLKSNAAQYELKYQHYSVVMCASRALAYFSAVNIDGTSMPPTYDRKNRLDLKNLLNDKQYERAADQWYYDFRIAREAQLGPALYDDPVTSFAFGHITRRADAVWGDEDQLMLANDDTFHITNCAPQVSSFNSGGDWGRLESAIARFARSNGGIKLCVISGPVLSNRDPEILGVSVPTAYWKVVVFVKDRKLHALGFMTFQTDKVDLEASRARKAYESLRELVEKSNTEQWLLPIRDIARETSLDFGPLLTADLVTKRIKKKLQMDEDRLAALFQSLG